MIGRRSTDRIDTIVIDRDASRMLDDLERESESVESEVGGVMCYDTSRRTVYVKNVIPIRDGSLDGGVFHVTPSSIKDSSRFHCANEQPIIVHTHPNGNDALSSNDKKFSDRYNIIICALAGKRLRCSDGDREIETRR